VLLKSWIARWYDLIILVFLAGLLLNLRWLVVFSVAVMVVILVGALWANRSLKGLTLAHRWRYRRGFPGENLDFAVEVHNRKLLPLTWISLSEIFPTAVTPPSEEMLAPSHVQDTVLFTHLFSLRGHEKMRRDFSLLLRKRGEYAIGPSTLSTGDPFGLYERTRDLPLNEYVTVFPEVLPFDDLGLPADDPFGDRRANRRLYDDPTQSVGIRDYRPDDDIRHIHWNATARTGQPQVKVYQPVSARVLVTCLNVHTTAQPWLGIYPELLEQVIKVSATIVYHASEMGYSVGLLSNGALAHADHPFQIMPGRSPDQLSRLLQTLACVTPYGTARFEDFLVRSLPRLPFGATLVLVSAMVTPSLAETLVRLKPYKRHTTLISLAQEAPPSIPGVRTVHLPFTY